MRCCPFLSPRSHAALEADLKDASVLRELAAKAKDDGKYWEACKLYDKASTRGREYNELPWEDAEQCAIEAKFMRAKAERWSVLTVQAYARAWIVRARVEELRAYRKAEEMDRRENREYILKMFAIALAFISTTAFTIIFALIVVDGVKVPMGSLFTVFDSDGDGDVDSNDLEQFLHYLNGTKSGTTIGTAVAVYHSEGNEKWLDVLLRLLRHIAHLTFDSLLAVINFGDDVVLVISGSLVIISAFDGGISVVLKKISKIAMRVEIAAQKVSSMGRRNGGRRSIVGMVVGIISLPVVVVAGLPIIFMLSVGLDALETLLDAIPIYCIMGVACCFSPVARHVSYFVFWWVGALSWILLPFDVIRRIAKGIHRKRKHLPGWKIINFKGDAPNRMAAVKASAAKVYDKMSLASSHRNRDNPQKGGRGGGGRDRRGRDRSRRSIFGSSEARPGLLDHM